MVSVPGISQYVNRMGPRPRPETGMGAVLMTRMPRTSETTWKKAAAAVAASSLLFASACGIGGGDAEQGLAAGDYTVAAKNDVINSVIVNGNIAPTRSLSITTPLQSEVQRVAVAAGDRVSVDQFLVEMDSTLAEQQLAQQQQQQADAQADAVDAAETAQQQLNAVQEQINQGTYPAIAQAQAAVNQAQAAYDAAISGQAPVAMDASAHHVRKFLDDISSGNLLPGHPAPAPAEVPAPAAQPASETVTKTKPETVVDNAQQVIAQQQANTVSQAGIAEAEGALSQAYAQLDVARSQAAQERDQLQRQADSAWRKAQSAGADVGDGSLEYQVQSATVTAPMAGLVTGVDVAEGDIPQGNLLTIADDSRLIIHTRVREADIPSIAKGNRVTFTSTATGDKEFEGKVRWIAPVGSTEDPKAGGAVTFPVDIEVTGNKDGLLLGGSARAEIVTDETPDALSIPRDAVYDDGAEKKVLVLSTGDGEKRGTVEERVVNTGVENEVDVAVTGGDLRAGDIVINWPDQYRDRVGDTLSVTDENFSPEDAAASDTDNGGENEG